MTIQDAVTKEPATLQGWGEMLASMDNATQLEFLTWWRSLGSIVVAPFHWQALVARAWRAATIAKEPPK